MILPLNNKNILITREKKQAREFSEKVMKHGGNPVEIPLLKIACQDHPENDKLFQQIDQYEWIFFTSINGVECFFNLMKQKQINEKVIFDKKIAAVGHKTEIGLTKRGIKADFIPTIYNADYMAREFLKQYSIHGPILLIRGNKSRDILPKQFSQLGIYFDSMEVYKTQYNVEAKKFLHDSLRTYQFDFITFTSPSTVSAFHEFIGDSLKINQRKLGATVCIGTTTEKRAREFGFTNILTPQEFTIDGMINSMIHYKG